MALFSAALADGGFEVYAIDLPGHGESKEPFHVELAEKAIQNATASLSQNTVVIGHSFGAGILLDLAATQHFTSMVLLAPPPLPVDQIRADRVLIATGSIDLPRIRNFVPIAADLVGSHVDTWILPLAAHTTPIFHPVYIKRIVDWLGGDGSKTRTGTRIAWLSVMLGAATVFGASWGSRRQNRRVNQQTGARILVVEYVVACGAAMILLHFVNPIGWIHLFGTDYLLGFILVAGLLLSAAAMYERGGTIRLDPTALFWALAAAIYVIVIVGFVGLSRVMHVSLSDGRLWRFPVILAAGIPLFASDELLIRQIEPQWKSVGVALLTRTLLLASLLTGALILNRESAFLILMAPPITLFWIGLWFAAAVIYKKTGDPLAAAFFSAVVQGWTFAAWFVTT